MTKDKPGLQMKYFVLKPQGTNVHAQASRAAMLKYAEVVGPCDRSLSNSLVGWATHEEVVADREPFDDADGDDECLASLENGLRKSWEATRRIKGDPHAKIGRLVETIDAHAQFCPADGDDWHESWMAVLEARKAFDYPTKDNDDD